MTANTTTQMARKSSPCGCGGSGATMASPCKCGGTGCSLCQNQGYIRPRFFAGQLLTDEDLQLLGDYVLAKNRLRNRYLVGSGVVCGLEVTCPPCGGATVTVNPGYAIDCCGNDIVLPCPQPLDINRMVRDLQLKMRGGFDCGDPCADAGTASTGPSSGGMPPSSGSASAKNGTQLPGSGNDATKTPDAARKYCLYVDYCEQPTDPVSPYATDDPCSPQTCEPTRIREGFRFELRCPEAAEPDPAICGRFWNCIGDPLAVERSVKESGLLREYKTEVRKALIKMATTPFPPQIVVATYPGQVQKAAADLKDAMTELEKSERKNFDQMKVQDLLRKIQNLASDAALFFTQASKTQEDLLGKGTPTHEEALSRAMVQLGKATSKETRALLESFMATTLERAHLSALLDVTEKLIPQIAFGGRAAGARVDSVEANEIKDTDVRILAAGATLNWGLLNASADSLEALRDWLLCRLEQAETKTDCDLLKKVLGVTLPSQSSGPGITLAEGGVLVSATEELTRAMQELLKSCFCNALNPPCPSCDDTGVLLACLTIKDCEVKDICNLERDFVITPLTIRYWIPEIERIGDSIEKWCCERIDECDETERQRDEDDSIVAGMGPAPFYVRLALLAIRLACPGPEKPGRPIEGMRTEFLSRLIWNLRMPTTVLERLAVAREGVPMQATVQEAVRKATADLKDKLGVAHSELERMSSDYVKLYDRVAKLERKKASEG